MDRERIDPFASAQRLLVLMAAVFAVITSNVILHPLLGPTPVVAEAGAASSSSSIPTPNPAHDERQCPFCLAGSGVFAAGPADAGPAHSIDLPPLPRRARAAAPRTREASPGGARAPPHDLRS